MQAFTRHAGIEVKTSDISLSGRILAASRYLTEAQRVPTRLPKVGRTGETARRANVIKLPNIQRVRTATDRQD